MLLIVFGSVFGFLILQRIAELVYAKRNEAIALQRGAVEYDPSGYKPIVLLHVLFFLSLVGEFFLAREGYSLLKLWDITLPEDIASVLLVVGILGFALGQSLRYIAFLTLGSRWNTKILVVSGDKPIQSGIYRWIKHPNYWGVKLELFFLPLAFACFGSAIFFSYANWVLLQRRIQKEEEAVYTISQKGGPSL